MVKNSKIKPLDCSIINYLVNNIGWCCRQSGVLDGEPVPPVHLSWFSKAELGKDQPPENTALVPSETFDEKLNC